MRATKLQTLSTIAHVIRKYKNKHCVASQQRMTELLVIYYKVSIKKRMLNYHLADLRKAGLIKSIKRTYRNRDGTITLNTSATCLTPTGYHELWKLGNEWAKKQYQRLISKYCPKVEFNKKANAAPPAEEIRRRRDLIPGIFQSEAFKLAFAMPE